MSFFDQGRARTAVLWGGSTNLIPTLHDTINNFARSLQPQTSCHAARGKVLHARITAVASRSVCIRQIKVKLETR